MARRQTEGIFDEGGVFGSLADAVGAQASAYGEAFRRVSSWAQAFVTRSLPRAQALVVEEATCEVLRAPEDRSSTCEHPALFRCSACRRHTCGSHAFVAVDGNAICFGCARGFFVAAPQQRPRRPAPQPPRRPAEVSVDEALRTLGVDRSTPWDEVRAAYRRMAHETHPDKFSQAGPDEQARAAERFRAVTAAFERLKAARKD